MRAGRTEEAIVLYLADAASTETPAADVSLQLARAYRRIGDGDATCRWSLAAAAAGDDFGVWRAAATLLAGCAPDDGPPPLRTARLALLGSYTTAQFSGMLRLAARQLGVRLEIYDAPYGQYRQEILDRDGAMHAFGPDLVLLCVHEGELALPEHSASPDADVDTELRRWTSLWEAVAAGSTAGVIQHGFAVPAEVALGHLAATLPGSRHAMTHALNARLGAAAAASAVSIVDCDRLSALHGKLRWFGPRYWHLSKQAVALDALPLLARHSAAVIAGRLGLGRKCLVLDLDNTLWGGVIGEDGLAGIRLGGGAEGEAFVAFQEYVLQLKRKGVLLAVSSKNNEADAREPFERHPEMRIRLDDVAAFVANWESKSDAIRTIAARLNIGLDSVVFVDDNPVERHAVRQRLPAVDVVRLPADPALYTRALADYLGFETSAFTAEDAVRTEQYRARARVAEASAAAGSIEDFYRGLAMQAIVAPFDELQLPRIAQLTGKTNQFNLTTRRHGLAELRAFMNDPRCVHLSLRLRDRFADHGLVGVIIAFGDGETLDIDTWLMSCRVLGRTADAEMLAQLTQRAAELGYATVRGSYVPTAKNSLVADVFEKFGFVRTSDDPGATAGTTRWSYDLRGGGPIRNGFIESVES